MADPATVKLDRQTPWGMVEFEERPPSNGSRAYRAYHITVDGQRRRVPSVTTVLGVLSKDALLRYREDLGATAAVSAEREGRLAGVEPDQVGGVLRDLGLGGDAQLKRAADRGTSIHDLWQAFVETGEPPNPAELAPELRAYVPAMVNAYLNLDRRGFEVEATEYLVAHPEYGYAGRADLRARIGGFSYIVDLKTNRHGRVWPDNHFQPVAYGLADEACGAEPVYGHLIVALGPDGGFEEMRACVTPADWLAVLDVYRLRSRLDNALRAERQFIEASA